MILHYRRVCVYLKKNLNASRPSEHPPVRGENVKTLRCDHRLQYKTSSCIYGFPDGKLHMAAQYGPVILIILSHSHCSSQGVLRDQLYLLRKPLIRRDKGDTLSLLVQL